jgi:hypothetical protein
LLKQQVVRIAFSLERQATGKKLIGNNSQAIAIAGGLGLVLHLLRGQIGQINVESATDGNIAIQQQGEAEIGDEQAEAIKQQAGGLDATMYYLSAMGIVDGARSLGEMPKRFCSGQVPLERCK